MNFMPFGQLKSFLKILIEVQYDMVKQSRLPPEGEALIRIKEAKITTPLKNQRRIYMPR